MSVLENDAAQDQICLHIHGIFSRRLPPRNSHFQNGNHQMTSEISQAMKTTDAKAAIIPR